MLAQYTFESVGIIPYINATWIRRKGVEAKPLQPDYGKGEKKKGNGVTS